MRHSEPLLIPSETGTGKEVLARAAHELSGRPGPFVPMNCGAIPASLIQSELFGVRKGAFSGADSDRSGIVLAAQNGTLFLDEIAELPEPSQAALLRVLQGGEVMALGSAKAMHADVRVVAATLQDLDARVSGGRFRNDLLARLRGHVVTLPPLRQRREDIGLLCAEILTRAAGARAPTIHFQRTAARALLSYAGPHNIRELEQVLGRALALLDGDEIRLEHLPAEVADPSGRGAPARGPDARAELVELMRLHHGNISAVARALGTSRSQVKRLLTRYAVELASAK